MVTEVNTYSSKMLTFLFSSQTAIAGTVFGFLILFFYLLSNIPKFANKGTNAVKKAPRAAGAWPVLGHLHLLARSGLPHIFLGDLADKYGPIFAINFGVHETFVVSDWKIAKQCFTTNDKSFVNRPKCTAVEFMGYNYAMFGLGPYGHYWRHMHKIIIHEVLSNKQVDLLSKIRVSEVRESIKDIYKGCCSSLDSGKVKVEMKQWFGSLTLNMVVRMIAGKRYDRDDEEGGRSLDALRKFFELMGAFVISDAIPILKWFDFDGYAKEMKKTGKEIDNILTGWLEEHKTRKKYREEGVSSSEVEEGDFMDVMSSILEGSSYEDLGGFDVDKVNKATCLTILTGSTDTTTVTLTWALSLLLNNPHILKAAQNELQIQVGRNRHVEESDTKNLTYLQAIVKETMRLYPAGPLSSPRESIDDCIVGGYHIPKGSRLIVNLSKIHRDPEVWLEPNEFKPERFLTRHHDVDIRGQHYELIPFGGGRRICPGISLAMQIVVLTLATLIHGFDMLSAEIDGGVDMSESFGLTNLKATPLEVFLTPRLYSCE